MATEKALREALRLEIVAKMLEMVKAEEPEADLVKSGEFMFPVVDAEGNEWFAKVAISIPTGSRDGEVYDGYEEAKAYAFKVKQDEEKAKAAAKAKAEKAARDAEKRAKRAAAAER